MDKEPLHIAHTGSTLEYDTRISARAKRMQLKVHPWGKVEVIVPRHVAMRHVAPFVRRHQSWLAHTLERIRSLHAHQPALSASLPSKIHFASINEEWELSFAKGYRTRISAEHEEDGRRTLRIETVEAAAKHPPLHRWLQDHARRCLIPWLQTVSDEHRLPFAQATVRAQKTRWGSCTARGHISLNRHLLFLPPHLVRYVMLHELCHTIHLNHSRRYWSLVQLHEPDYATHEAELRQATSLVPLWACRTT